MHQVYQMVLLSLVLLRQVLAEEYPSLDLSEGRVIRQLVVNTAAILHAVNRQDIDFVCNCCADHCLILKSALAQPRPGLAFNSGFQPKIEQEGCAACDLCVDNCPATALALSEDDILLLDTDRCLGCGVCATTCPTEAIALVEKTGRPEPPVDDEALRATLKDQPAAF